MEMLIIFAFIIGFVIGVLLAVNYKENIYFNSWVYERESHSFSPEFTVVKIEESSDINGRPIAKYTVINYFFSKENNKGFKYQTFYFYDQIDKYVVGQNIRFK